MMTRMLGEVAVLTVLLKCRYWAIVSAFRVGGIKAMVDIAEDKHNVCCCIESRSFTVFCYRKRQHETLRHYMPYKSIRFEMRLHNLFIVFVR